MSDLLRDAIKAIRTRCTCYNALAIQLFVQRLCDLWVTSSNLLTVYTLDHPHNRDPIFLAAGNFALPAWEGRLLSLMSHLEVFFSSSGLTWKLSRFNRTERRIEISTQWLTGGTTTNQLISSISTVEAHPCHWPSAPSVYQSCMAILVRKKVRKLVRCVWEQRY